jgi:hypothetical protein
MIYCAVQTSVDSNDILYIVRKYCTVLRSVDSNDMLYRYCTVHYSRTLCHYYINTVQYITYSVNTVHYITEVHYLICKLYALLTSVDSTDILCITDISRQ